MTQKRRSSDPEIQELKNHTEEMRSDIKEIKVAILGNLDGGKDGLFTRVEINKQNIKRVSWLTGILFVAIIGLCGKIIYASI